MSAAATVLKMPNVADDLPDVLTPIIRRELVAELARELPKCETQDDRLATMVSVYAKWYCRAARFYASNHIDALREQMAERLKSMLDRLEEVERRNEILSHRIDVGQLQAVREEIKGRH